MTREEWQALDDELAAIDSQMDDLDQRRVACLKRLQEIEDHCPEFVGYCEFCITEIWAGDMCHNGRYLLCEECTPTFSQMLARPKDFEHECMPVTLEKAQELCSAHLAAGGSIDDKMEMEVAQRKDATE